MSVLWSASVSAVAVVSAVTAPFMVPEMLAVRSLASAPSCWAAKSWSVTP